MNKEFNALLANGTLTLVPKPLHANLVGCKWVYKIKRKVDGGIERFKAHLIAKGFLNRMVLILARHSVLW